MVATLKLRTEQLAKYRTLAGLTTDRALAERMGFDPGNLSRVLAGKQAPGPKFIAAIVSAPRYGPRRPLRSRRQRSLNPQPTQQYPSPWSRGTPQGNEKEEQSCPKPASSPGASGFSQSQQRPASTAQTVALRRS